jgi:hypothetical protein
MGTAETAMLRTTCATRIPANLSGQTFRRDGGQRRGVIQKRQIRNQREDVGDPAFNEDSVIREYFHEQKFAKARRLRRGRRRRPLPNPIALMPRRRRTAPWLQIIRKSAVKSQPKSSLWPSFLASPSGRSTSGSRRAYSASSGAQSLQRGARKALTLPPWEVYKLETAPAQKL